MKQPILSNPEKLNFKYRQRTKMVPICNNKYNSAFKGIIV